MDNGLLSDTRAQGEARLYCLSLESRHSGGLSPYIVFGPMPLFSIHETGGQAELDLKVYKQQES